MVWTWTLSPKLGVLVGKVMIPLKAEACWRKYISRSVLWGFIAWPQSSSCFLCIDTMWKVSFQFCLSFLPLLPSLSMPLWTLSFWDCELKIHSFPLISFFDTFGFCLFGFMGGVVVVVLFVLYFRDVMETNTKTNTLQEESWLGVVNFYLSLGLETQGRLFWGAA